MQTIKVGLFKTLTFTSEYIDKDKYLLAFLLYKNKQYEIRKYKISEDFCEYVHKLKMIDSNKIRMSKILKINNKERYVIEESPRGENMLKLFIEDKISEKHFESLFLMYRFLRFAKHDIDYRPQNFVCNEKGELTYIGKEIFDSNPKLNLENYGLRFWFDSFEAKQNAKENGFELTRKILSPAEINKKIVLTSIKNW